MSATATTADGILKVRYDDGRKAKLVYDQFPLTSWIEKKTGESGKKLIYPVKYGNAQSVGGTLSVAQTVDGNRGGSSKSDDWTVDWGDYSAALTIDDKLIAMGKGNAGAFWEAKTDEIDGLYTTCGEVFERYAFSDSGRNLGSFTISIGVCTMINAADIVNVHEGMEIQASANTGDSGSDTLLGSGSIGYCYNVNQNAGTFTVATSNANAVAGTAGTPGSWSGTMYAFRSGDFGGSGATAIFQGMGAWCPASDPSSTAFNGIDRTKNMIALSGTRIPSGELTGLDIEGRIKTLITRMCSRGYIKGTDELRAYLNTEKWQVLAELMEAKGYRDITGGAAIAGFESISIVAGGRKVRVLSSQFCPTSTCFCLTKDAYKLHALEGLPSEVNGDGLKLLRKTGANSYELRLQAYPASSAIPGKMGRVAV